MLIRHDIQPLVAHNDPQGRWMVVQLCIHSESARTAMDQDALLHALDHANHLLWQVGCGCVETFTWQIRGENPRLPFCICIDSRLEIGHFTYKMGTLQPQCQLPTQREYILIQDWK